MFGHDGLRPTPDIVFGGRRAGVNVALTLVQRSPPEDRCIRGFWSRQPLISPLLLNVSLPSLLLFTAREGCRNQRWWWNHFGHLCRGSSIRLLFKIYALRPALVLGAESALNLPHHPDNRLTRYRVNRMWSAERSSVFLSTRRCFPGGPLAPSMCRTVTRSMARHARHHRRVGSFSFHFHERGCRWLFVGCEKGLNPIAGHGCRRSNLYIYRDNKLCG